MCLKFGPDAPGKLDWHDFYNNYVRETVPHHMVRMYATRSSTLKHIYSTIPPNGQCARYLHSFITASRFT